MSTEESIPENIEIVSHAELPSDITRQCHYCGQQDFSNAVELVQHVVSAHPDRECHSGPGKGHIKCDFCEARFTLPCSKQRHMQSKHMGMKPYECGSCGKSFFRNSMLQQHLERVHLQAKVKVEDRGDSSQTKNKRAGVFPCQLCSKSFSYKGSLRTHVNNFHLKKDPDEKSVRRISVDRKKHVKWRCMFCEKLMYSRHTLARHMRSKHASEKGKNQCGQCSKSYVLQESLAHHVASAHLKTKEPGFECIICERIFGDMDVLREHEVKEHAVFTAGSGSKHRDTKPEDINIY